MKLFMLTVAGLALVVALAGTTVSLPNKALADMASPTPSASASASPSASSSPMPKPSY